MNKEELEAPEFDDDEYVEREDAHPGEKKIPVLKGMGDYILSKYRTVLIEALNSACRNGVLSEIAGVEVMKVHEMHPVDFSFYRRNRAQMEADIRLWIHVTLREKAGVIESEIDAGLTLFLDLGTWACECLDVWDTENAPERKTAWKLDDSLVPYIPNSMKETRADQIWLAYMECGLFDPQSRAPVLLAYEMGLDCIEIKDASMDSAFILFAQDPPMVFTAGQGQEAKQYTITKDTLVLNSLRMNGQPDDLEVFEHVVRYEWHYMFYRLNGLTADQPAALPREWVPEEKRFPESLRIALMQARRGAYSLLLPSGFMKEYISEHAKKASRTMRFFDYRNHAAAILEETAKMMRKDFPTLKLSWIKTRYLHMGDIAARGIFHPTDGHYMDAFDFSSDEIAGGSYTPAIGFRARVLSMFYREEYFRRIMETGEYVFADGLIMRNHPDFVMETEKGLRATPLGNMDADGCSLWFKVKWVKKIRRYTYSFKKEEYERAIIRHEPEVREARQMRLQELEKTESVHEMIALLIQTGPGTDEVAKRSMLSRRRLEELSGREMKRYYMDELVALSLGLQLEPPVSGLLIKKAGLTFLEEDPGRRRAILCCLFRESVPELQAYLSNERLNHDKVSPLELHEYEREGRA